MAINKSNSPMWVKITLIVLIVAFVASFIVIASNPFASDPQAQTGAPADGTLAAADAQYQPQIAALTTQLQSDPQNYATLVSLGNTYFDWALAKQQAGQTDATAIGADQPLWLAAKDAYSRAVAIKDDESPVRVDYAITVFYSGDTVTAIKLGEAVVKDDPEFGPAQFNLGVFYEAAGQAAKAIAAYEMYLKLDPEGSKGGSPDFAKERVAELKTAGANPAPSTPTTP